MKREWGFAVALLGVVAFTHLGYEVLAQAVVIDRASVFYVARGFEGVFLYGVWVGHSPYVTAVALWGMAESALTSVCGSLYIVEPIDPAPFQGLCDAKSGLPVFYYMGLVAASLLALVLVLNGRRRV